MDRRVEGGFNGEAAARFRRTGYKEGMYDLSVDDSQVTVFLTETSPVLSIEQLRETGLVIEGATNCTEVPVFSEQTQGSLKVRPFGFISPDGELGTVLYPTNANNWNQFFSPAETLSQ